MARKFGSDYEDGTPFWRIFSAVLLAMIAYGLLKFAVLSLMAKAAVDAITSSTPVQTQPAVHEAPVSREYEAVPEVSPLLPGPLEARRTGASQACIAGYVSERLPDGWSQSKIPCRASSQ